MFRALANAAPLRARAFATNPASASHHPYRSAIRLRSRQLRVVNYSTSSGSSKESISTQGGGVSSNDAFRNQATLGGSMNKGILALAMLTLGLIGFRLARSDFFSTGIKPAITVTGYDYPEESRKHSREKQDPPFEENVLRDCRTTSFNIPHDQGFPSSNEECLRSPEDVFKLANNLFFQSISDFDCLLKDVVMPSFPQTETPLQSEWSNPVSWQTFRTGMDLHEDPEKNLVSVTFELPGMKKDDIQLEVGDGFLTVSAEMESSTQRDADSDKNGYTIRRFGKISRSLRLPKGVKDDDIQATMADGVLTVTFPKISPGEESRNIMIA